MAFVQATAMVAVLGIIARFVAIVNSNLGALVALVFLGMTVHIAKKRGKDLVDFGYHTAPVLRSLVTAGLYIAIVFPIFMFGFVFFYDLACGEGSAIAQMAPPGLCPRFLGWAGAHWPSLGLATLELAFVQVIVVALPEELFFRGLIHELCEKAMPPKRRVVGGGIGWALVISSALFALGHLAVTFDARRLAVFFPGLAFGWMRSATGSIFAGVIAHAASNLFIHILQLIFF